VFADPGAGMSGADDITVIKMSVSVGASQTRAVFAVLKGRTLSEPISSHTDSDMISATALVRGIGAMIGSGDIRNVAHAQRALHAGFTTSGRGPFGLNYELLNVIPGVDPASFEYWVNDTGQEPSPYGAFSYVPPIPANRKAALRLTLDVYHLCIRGAQIPSELHRRGIRFRGFMEDGENTYVIPGPNEIRVRLSLFGGCVRDVDIAQITDVKHAVVPVTKVAPGRLPG
jgi:hypothetical protein